MKIYRRDAEDAKIHRDLCFKTPFILCVLCASAVSFLTVPKKQTGK
jgi:hypothetical protein